MDDLLLLVADWRAASGFDAPGDFFRDDDGRLTHRGDRRRRAPAPMSASHILEPDVIDAWPDGAVLASSRIWMAMAAAGPAAWASCMDGLLDARRRSGGPRQRRRRGSLADARVSASFLDRPAPALVHHRRRTRPFLDDLAAGLAGVLAPLEPQEALADAIVLMPTRRGAPGACADAFLAAARRPRAAAAADPRPGRPRRGRAAVRARRPRARPAAGDHPRPPALRAGAGWSPSTQDLLGPRARRRRAPWSWPTPWPASSTPADRGGRDPPAARRPGRGRPGPALAGLAPSSWTSRWRPGRRGWPSLGLIGRRRAPRRPAARAWPSAGATEPPPASLVAAGLDRHGAGRRRPAGRDRRPAARGGGAAGPRPHPRRRGLGRGRRAAPAGRAEAAAGPRGRRRAARCGPGRQPAPAARGRWRRRLINEALRPAERTADWLRPDRGACATRATARGVDPDRRGPGRPVGRHRPHRGGGGGRRRPAAARGPGDARPHRRPGHARPGAGAPGQRAADPLGRSRPTPPPARRWPACRAGGLAWPGRAGQPPIALDPVTLLAIVKHPLTRLGLELEDLADARRTLERYGLRGPRRATGRPHGAAGRRLEPRAGRTPAPPRRAAGSRPRGAGDALQAALDVAERAVRRRHRRRRRRRRARPWPRPWRPWPRTPRGGFGGLWAGPDGEAAAGLLAGLIDESDGLPDVDPAGLRRTARPASSAGETVRAGGASHPRLRSWAPRGAAGAAPTGWSWPGWRKGSGRPARRSTLPVAAHARAPRPAAAGAAHRPFRPRLRPGRLRARGDAADAERRDGAPAVDSRWLWRLQTLVAGRRHRPAGPRRTPSPGPAPWTRPLTAPPAHLAPATRPEPTPPLAARPRKLPVTGVETWVRDPYAIYARDILRLRAAGRRRTSRWRPWPAARPSTPPSSASPSEHPASCPTNPEAVFAAILLEALDEAGMPDAAHGARAGPGAQHRPLGGRPSRPLPPRRRAASMSSRRASWSSQTPGGPFRLHRQGRPHRAPRRPRRRPRLQDRHAAERQAGAVRPRAPAHPHRRHPGRAAASRRSARPRRASSLYVRVSGGRIPGVGGGARRRRRESATLAEAALEGLQRRIAWFDEEPTPYRSWAAPQFMGHYGGDYDHLARVWEWDVIGDDDERRAAHEAPGRSAQVARRRPGRLGLRHRQRRLGQDLDPGPPGRAPAAARARGPRRSSASPTPRPPPPRCSGACSRPWATGR